MKLNEKGSSLPIALLVIFVLTVLGLSLMGNVVGENKRVNTTEMDVQDRYLAENGLTYFENDFKNTVSKMDFSLINITNFPQYLNSDFLNQYLTSDDLKTYLTTHKLNDYTKTINDANGKIETLIMAEPSTDSVNGDTIKVTSVVKPNSDGKGKALVAYYKPSFLVDVDTIPKQIAQFDKSGTIPVDFNDSKVAQIGILNIINDLSLLEFSQSDDKFYPVPTSGGIRVSIAGLKLGLLDNFDYLNNMDVVAVRNETALSLALLHDSNNNNSVLTVDVNSYADDGPTNVLINGSNVVRPSLLSPSYDGFKKLAVTGNAIIQQSGAKPRQFSFTEGLLVKKSLVIGGATNVGNLKLQGNIFTDENLTINNVNLEMGDPTINDAIYVNGDATIDNACINNNLTKKLRVFTKGTLTLKNNSICNAYNGIFYAEKGITIETNNKPITINGGLIGDVTKVGSGAVTVNQQGLENIRLENVQLSPLGRTFQNE